MFSKSKLNRLPSRSDKQSTTFTIRCYNGTGSGGGSVSAKANQPIVNPTVNISLDNQIYLTMAQRLFAGHLQTPHLVPSGGGLETNQLLAVMLAI